MFYNCTSLTTLDVSGWNTSNVTQNLMLETKHREVMKLTYERLADLRVIEQGLCIPNRVIRRYNFAWGHSPEGFDFWLEYFTNSI